MCLLIVVVVFDFPPWSSILIKLRFLYLQNVDDGTCHVSPPLPDNDKKSLSTDQSSLSNEVKYVAS